MDEKTKNKIRKTLQEHFEGSWEKGGGYNYRYHHSLRVARYALKLAKTKKLDVDEDALYLAALCHDIKKIYAVDDEGEIDCESRADKEHEDISAKELSEYLEGCDLRQDLIKKAAKIIRGKDCTERKVLKDADELDSFGYLQVFRTCAYTALDKSNVDNIFDYWLKNKEEREKEGEEIFKRLHFETTKKVAKKRLKRLKKFLHGLKQENKGEDIK